MDVQMPGLDGLEASRRIRQRQQEPSPHPHFRQALTIIAMTANARQGDREKCFAAGMNDYIPKPVRPEALQTAIERFGPVATTAGQQVLAEANISSSSDSQAQASAAPAPLAEENPSVDLERLIEFAGGELENFQELVTLYRTQTKQQLAQIFQAIRQGDASAASSVAHSCAGASSTCGMVAIMPILREIEHCGKAGDLAALPSLYTSANSEFERIEQFFESRKFDSLPH